MKIKEILSPDFGKAFKRISSAFHRYSPNNIEWVETNQDVTLVHVVGGAEIHFLEEFDNLIIVQHCYLTTDYQNIPWETYWKKAILNIAFRDLREVSSSDINFCHTPWGADTHTFYNIESTVRDIDVFSTGHVASTEHLDTLFHACEATAKMMYHTGENFKYNRNHYRYMPYMDDLAYRNILNRSRYVSCLREVEGFEMAGVEGLLCGAVPIVPNLPTYSWYKGYGVFVDMDGDVQAQLQEILMSPPPKVDFASARETFGWEKIVNNIFAELDKYL